MQIKTSRDDPLPSFALFALGFRPFFLAAGVAAVTLLSIWLFLYSAGGRESTYYGSVGWHGHEMLFGFAVAVISGFLLTAVRNWTSIPTLSGKPLAALAGLWLLGRILPFFPEALPSWLIATTDFLFLPIVAIALSVPLLKSGMKRNLIFIAVLLAMALANLLIHLQQLGFTNNTAALGTTLIINLIILLITIMGGRVIPFFIERALPGATVKRWRSIEVLAITTVLALVVADLFPSAGPITLVIALFAAASHGVRYVGWHNHRLWSVPLLWVLFSSYGWIIIGFLLKALAASGSVSPFLALHAFTVGGIGMLTLGMMARVSLGHTGRKMAAGRLLVLAFFLINLAALVRVLFPLALPEFYPHFIYLSGGLWIGAFLLFTIAYTPVLTRPRVDGRPG